MAYCTNTESSLDILVVEDETVASIELECVLEELGHRVVDVAVSPLSAEKALRTRKIDAVIFGATLVGLPPYALAETLEQLGLPAAVTSAHSEDFVRVLGFKAPFVAKPFARDDVARVLASFEIRDVATAA